MLSTNTATNATSYWHVSKQLYNASRRSKEVGEEEITGFNPLAHTTHEFKKNSVN